MTLTPEQEREIAQAAANIKDQQQAENRGTTAKDFRDMATKNQNATPYKQVDPLGLDPQSFERAITGTGSAAGAVAGTLSAGAQKVQKGSAAYHYDQEHPPTGRPNIAPAYRSGMAAITPPAFTSTKGKPTPARIFKYSGSVDAHPHVHGAGQPNFGMGAHPVNFGQGSALPHGAAGGSGTPTTGSAVNVGNLSEFGSAGHTAGSFGTGFKPLGGAMSTPSFGMNDGILRSAAGAGVRTGGATFGLNDGILKGAAIGKLNFQQGVLAKNKASKYAKKKGTKK